MNNYVVMVNDGDYYFLVKAWNFIEAEHKAQRWLD